MTRDEILALKPGRELDALVAEKVFGRNDYDWDDTHWYCPTCKAWVHPAQVTYYEVHERCQTPVVSDWCDADGNVMPNYSTDISAAWEVVEYMRTRNDNGAFIDIYPGADEFYVTARGKYDYHVTAQNAPEAICKAALLAVMDGEDEHERD